MRILLYLVVSWCFATSTLAQDGAALASLRAAYVAQAKGKWDEALDLAKPAGQVAVDLIQWDRLRAGRGQFSEATAFLKRRPDWPGLPYLRQRSEATIEPDAAPQDVIAFSLTIRRRLQRALCDWRRHSIKLGRKRAPSRRHNGDGAVLTYSRASRTRILRCLGRI